MRQVSHQKHKSKKMKKHLTRARHSINELNSKLFYKARFSVSPWSVCQREALKKKKKKKFEENMWKSVHHLRKQKKSNLNLERSKKKFNTIRESYLVSPCSFHHYVFWWVFLVTFENFNLFFEILFFCIFNCLETSGGTAGLLDLNLNLRHGGTGAAKVGRTGLGVLGVVVRDGRLDGILGKHGAVHCFTWLAVSLDSFCKRELTLDGRKAQFLSNVGVTDLAGFLESHAADQLGEVGRAGDGAAAAESLELDVADRVRVLVDTDLKLHHVTAGRGTDETAADVLVDLHGSGIPRVVVVVEQC